MKLSGLIKELKHIYLGIHDWQYGYRENISADRIKVIRKCRLCSKSQTYNKHLGIWSYDDPLTEHMKKQIRDIGVPIKLDKKIEHF